MSRLPSFAMRPIISWPKIQPSSESRSGASPRQKWRSEPQMFASETLMSAASGSTSGSVTSRISNGLPGPKKTAALPVAIRRLLYPDVVTVFRSWKNRGYVLATHSTFRMVMPAARVPATAKLIAMRWSS